MIFETQTNILKQYLINFSDLVLIISSSCALNKRGKIDLMEVIFEFYQLKYNFIQWYPMADIVVKLLLLYFIFIIQSFVCNHTQCINYVPINTSMEFNDFYLCSIIWQVMFFLRRLNLLHDEWNCSLTIDHKNLIMYKNIFTYLSTQHNVSN